MTHKLPEKLPPPGTRLNEKINALIDYLAAQEEQGGGKLVIGVDFAKKEQHFWDARTPKERAADDDAFKRAETTTTLDNDYSRQHRDYASFCKASVHDSPYAHSLQCPWHPSVAVKAVQDTPEQPTQEWEAELQFEILEDYLRHAEHKHLVQNRTEHMKLMREDYDKLKAFITRLLSRQKRELLEKVRECVPDDVEDYLVGYNKGWNACRNRFLSNLDSLTKEI